MPNGQIDLVRNLGRQLVKGERRDQPDDSFWCFLRNDGHIGKREPFGIYELACDNLTPVMPVPRWPQFVGPTVKLTTPRVGLVQFFGHPWVCRQWQ